MINIYLIHLGIKGPGAGVEVTASGVFGDILKVANII